MATRDLTQQELTQLKSLIDATGIESVLMGISEIAHERSEQFAPTGKTVASAYAGATVAGAVGATVSKALGL